MPFSGFRGFGAASRPAAEFPVLPPEEEESLLRRIMGTAMGSLQFVGQTLDKPGAAVRGLLGGQGPEALLNLVPFSDSIGLTDPTERIYGRDLLEKADILEKNKPGLDWGDVAGFGADVFLDPLSWLNPLGGLSKGGHVARSAGILDNLPGLAKESALKTGTGSLSKRGMRSENTLRALIEKSKASAADDVARQQIDEAVSGAAGKLGYDLPGLLDERLGGGIGFSMGPFGKSIALGGEARPVGAYGSALDKIGEAVTYGKFSPVPALSAGFSKAVKENTDPVLQQELRAFDSLKSKIEPQEILRGNQLRDELGEAYQKANIDPNDIQATMAFKAYSEGQLAKFPHLEKYLPPEVRKVADETKQRIDTIRAQQEAIGLKSDTKRLNSKYGVEYAPRYAKDGKPLDLPREDLLDVPGGTVEIERLRQDFRLAPAKVLTMSEKSRAMKILEQKGFTVQELRDADKLAKQVRESKSLPAGQRFGLKDMSIHEKYLFKSRRAAIREARGQKAPLQGEVARHQIIFRDTFGMTDQQFASARKLKEEIKKTAHLPNNHPQKILDPRKIPETSVKDITELQRQRDLLNKFEHSKDLANWVKSKGYHSPDNLLFPQHSIQDARTYAVSQRGQLEYGNMAQDVLARSSKTLGELGGKKEGYTNINIAFKELGFDDITKAMNHFAEKTGGRFGDVAENVDAYVPKSVVDSLAKTFKRGKYNTPFDDPKEVNAAVGFYDSLTNLFKTGVTAHPAFHIRNKFTGTIQNAISGAYRLSQAKKYEWDVALPFSRGEVVEGLSKFPGIQKAFGKGLSDAEATTKLREAVDAYDLRGSRFDEIVEDVAGREVVKPSPWENLNPDLLAKPGAGPIGLTTPFKTFGSTVKESYKEGGVKGAIGSVINPFRMAGVGKGVVPEGVPLKAGEVVETSASAAAQRQSGRVVEDMNRISALVGYLDKGMSLEAAVRRVKATHVDYKALSQFERSFMRRVMPFYSFSRGIAENTAKELMEHPGGNLAQTIRASNSGREGGGHVPDYIGEGLAIPLGPDKYLARLGLMHEAAFDPFAFRTQPGDEEGEASSLDVFRTPSRTLQKVLSMTNPLIKTPIELATDKNLFTGREHKDLYPYPLREGLLRGDFATLGNIALGASPVSRGIRTVRKLSDERKSIPEKVLSGLAGVGITDVYKGAEQAKELDAQRAAEELLEQSPRIKEYSTLYSPESLRGGLTPTEKSLLRLQSTTNKRNREKAKEAALR